MNITLLLETYQKMSPSSKAVFIDTLSQISSYIRTIPCTILDVSGGAVEGNSFVLFVYKNNLGHCEEVRKHFDTSDSMQLGALSLMRMEIIDILIEGKVVQKCYFSKEAKEILKEKFGIGEDIIESFPRDGVSGKHIFDPTKLYREGGNVVCEGKSISLSKLNEDEKNALSLYEKIVKGLGSDTITEILNLDESYFQYDLLLTDRANIEKLKDILISDENKELIHFIDFKEGDIILNNKAYIFELSRKGDGKSIEFINLLSAFFSKYNKERLILGELVEFIEKKEFRLHKITTIDLSDSKKMKSHIKVFHDTLWKRYGGKPIIFEMKGSSINLKQMKNVWISSSPEIGLI